MAEKTLSKEELAQFDKALKVLLSHQRQYEEYARETFDDISSVDKIPSAATYYAKRYVGYVEEIESMKKFIENSKTLNTKQGQAAMNDRVFAQNVRGLTDYKKLFNIDKAYFIRTKQNLYRSYLNLLKIDETNKQSLNCYYEIQGTMINSLVKVASTKGQEVTNRVIKENADLLPYMTVQVNNKKVQEIQAGYKEIRKFENYELTFEELSDFVFKHEELRNALKDTYSTMMQKKYKDQEYSAELMTMIGNKVGNMAEHIRQRTEKVLNQSIQI